MGTMIHNRVAALLADLDQEIAKVINKHFAEDEKAEKVLQYHGPFTVQISGVDGIIARFMEDGIDLYPEETH